MFFEDITAEFIYFTVERNFKAGLFKTKIESSDSAEQ